MAAKLNPLAQTWLLVAITCFASGSVTSAEDSEQSPPKSVLAQQDDYYAPTKVQTIELSVDEADLKRMIVALPERIYVRASFRWRDINLQNVAIRFKGNSSSSPSQKHKRSFLIKFNEYDKDQRFLGLRRVSLDNAIQFGSLFSESIITDILRDMDIVSHRCNYAKLFLNGKYHGVYTNVERIDESFIATHLPDPHGMLFKVDEGGPAGNLQYIGDDPDDYQKTFEPDTRSAKGEHQRLVEFIRMINQSNDTDIAANLASKMELQDFLRVTAVMLFSGAFDQLTGWNPHNYYLYFDRTHERWRYLPWDLDVGFCELPFGKIRVLNDWNAVWPAAGQMPNPLIDRIVADPILLQQYRVHAQSILDKYFEPDRLCGIIDAKYELIKDDLKTDPFPHRRITNPEDRNYDEIVASMKAFVRKRFSSARDQLENPGKRPDPSPHPDGPTPQLVNKVQKIQKAAHQMQRSGKDMRPLQKLMEQAGPLMNQGKFIDAEKLIDLALKVIEGKAEGNAPETPPK